MVNKHSPSHFQAHQLYLDIDALKDPNPDKASKAYPRKRPTDPDMVKACNPPIGNTLATKLRMWQILPSVVDTNPHWLSTHRIVANGVAWGDETDPVLPEAKKRKAQSSAAPQARPKKPKPTVESREAAEATSYRRPFRGNTLLSPTSASLQALPS